MSTTQISVCITTSNGWPITRVLGTTWPFILSHMNYLGICSSLQIWYSNDLVEPLSSHILDSYQVNWRSDENPDMQIPNCLTYCSLHNLLKISKTQCKDSNLILGSRSAQYLFIKGKEFHIHLTWRFIDGRGFPMYPSRGIQGCLCHQGDLVIPIGTENRSLGQWQVWNDLEMQVNWFLVFSIRHILDSEVVGMI